MQLLGNQFWQCAVNKKLIAQLRKEINKHFYGKNNGAKTNNAFKSLLFFTNCRYHFRSELLVRRSGAAGQLNQQLA